MANPSIEMMLQWLLASQANNPAQQSQPQRQPSSPIEEALATRLATPQQQLDLTGLVREARNTPVADAQNAHQARMASDPWGPGGAFEGRRAADLVDPTALAASQGRTAANQWAMVTGQGGGAGVDVPLLTSLLSGNNPAIANQRQQTKFDLTGPQSRIIPEAPTIGTVPTPFTNAGDRTISGSYGSGSAGVGTGGPSRINGAMTNPPSIPFDQAAWEAANPEAALDIRNSVYSSMGLNHLIKPTQQKPTNPVSSLFNLFRR